MRRPYPEGVELNAESAAAALERVIGDDVGDGTFRVRPVGRGILWHGVIVDQNGLPLAGGSWLIGPDERSYSISSNPGIHDAVLAIEMLEAAYDSGLSARLDPGKFGEALQGITRRRTDEVKRFVDDLRGGSFRSSAPRALP